MNNTKSYLKGFNSAGNQFLFEKSLDDRVAGIINQYSEGKQVLVFCSSKKGCETLVNSLSVRMGNIGKVTTFGKLYDNTLASLISKGYAYHHSGIPPDDRLAVENAFLNGGVRILCATSTLAHGVNLPAHLVIIKGTNQWQGGNVGYQSLTSSTIQQMIGKSYSY